MSAHKRGDMSHAMTDLMAGLAVSFLLLACVFIVAEVNYHEDFTAEFSKPAEQVQQIATVLKAQHHAVDVSVSEKDSGVLLVDLKIEFKAGVCTVEDNQLKTAAEAVKTVLHALGNTPNARLYLEGHTDNMPFTGTPKPECARPLSAACQARKPGEPWSSACCNEILENNIRLSSARAQESFFKIRKMLSPEDQQRLDRLIVVSGRGPLAPDTPFTAAQKCEGNTDIREEKANRRVVARLVVSPPPVAPPKAASPSLATGGAETPTQAP